MLLTSLSALAAEPPQPAPGLSVWDRTAYKTVSYEILATLTDQVVLEVLAPPASVAVGAAFLAANVVTAAGTYYAHEITWAFLGPDPRERAGEQTGKKAVTYGAVCVVRNYGLAYAFVGDPNIAAAYAVLASFADVAVYVGNEFVWDWVSPPVYR